MVFKFIVKFKLSIAILSAIWLVLGGNFSIVNIAVGLLLSSISVYFAHRLLLTRKWSGVNVIKFVIYPFYLIWQIYSSGFSVIKMIVRGVRTDTITVHTALKNEFLITTLCNSITLIPGSVVLERDGQCLSVMVLREKSAPTSSEVYKSVEMKVMEPEGMLLKMQSK